VAAALPDIDTFTFAFGVNYGDFLGHRGFAHSLTFAALVALALAFTAFPRERFDVSRTRAWSYVFLCVASHGALDAMTNEGLGVAFFSPFNLTRYFFPWHPIQVSPIGVGAFFSADGLAVVKSELLYIVLPAVAFMFVARALRRAKPLPMQAA
jgi:inner membrane protein